MHPARPPRLAAGDVVAVVSPSWGGPSVFPHTFDAGVRALQEVFGLEVRELPTARMDAAALARDPRRRAADVNAAFADAEVKAVIASIGGNDSARLLPFVDEDAIRANPKVLMGYSDTSTLLVAAHLLGLVTFNGPSVMAGFAQLSRFPAVEAHVRSLLFAPAPTYDYEPYAEWVDHYPDWNEVANADRVGPLRPHDGWHWVNGGRVEGRLFGGCIEVLEFLKGSRWWPDEEFWAGRILFLETSEEKPTVEQVGRWLFSYGVQGVFDRAAALLLGRARSYTDEEKRALDRMVRDVVVEQFGAHHLPIVTNLDFGHTDPQWILPLGVLAEVDCEARRLRLLEPAVA
jgi:muramoyltetrapeptide carboxypeptidase LdcA involved in peptidoglycan recycling